MTGRPDVPLPDESHGPYTEGWPKMFAGLDPIEVVPLSDAERLQEALEMLADSPKELPTWARHIARVTLDREGERISSWPSRKAFERDTARRNMRMGERGDYCPTCGSPDKAEGCPECGLPCDNEWHGEYRAGFEEARLRKALKRALDESHTYETLRGRVIAALGRKGEE
jgi:hypothetical protein